MNKVKIELQMCSKLNRPPCLRCAILAMGPPEIHAEKGKPVATPETQFLPVHHPRPPMPKILLVDDDESFRGTLGKLLKFKGFRVVEAASVPGALKLIGAQTFDALLSDLHMPAPGDGLTVISAMRHSHPQAITILLSAYPELDQAAAAILKQADEVLVKPIRIDALVGTITERLKQGATPARAIESLASILEQELQATIEDWLQSVDSDPLLAVVRLDDDQRCAHLPQMFRDLIVRLRNPLPLGQRALVSPAAQAYGMLRRRQGYTAAMLVEESRMLQVSIFQTLQDNLHRTDFKRLLTGVMAIADEVDSQLAQAMRSYISESIADREPSELPGAA
jgi:CheY-like chemotaxis protein